MQLSPIKVKIIKLFEKEEKLTFKDIKDSLNISTDSLKFNLNDLISEGIIVRERGKYMLTEKGKEILKEIVSK